MLHLKWALQPTPCRMNEEADVLTMAAKKEALAHFRVEAARLVKDPTQSLERPIMPYVGVFADCYGH